MILFFPGNNAPINFEIGCGTGEFIINKAISNPNENYIGNDLSRRSIFFAANQLKNKNIPNLHLLRADFKVIFKLFPSNTINSFYLRFPDPNYGGITQNKRKIISKKLITFLNRSLITKGTFYFITDQKIVFDETASLINESKNFIPTSPNEIPEKSRFHASWERINREIHQVSYTKKIKTI